MKFLYNALCVGKKKKIKHQYPHKLLQLAPWLVHQKSYLQLLTVCEILYNALYVGKKKEKKKKEVKLSTNIHSNFFNLLLGWSIRNHCCKINTFEQSVKYETGHESKNTSLSTLDLLWFY